VLTPSLGGCIIYGAELKGEMHAANMLKA